MRGRSSAKYWNGENAYDRCNDGPANFTYATEGSARGDRGLGIVVTHAQALEQNLAEKYLLFELNEQEREAFEMHFFACQECAVALRDGAVFMDTARDLVPAAVVPDAKPSLWERWFPQSARPAFAMMAAALMLVCGGSLFQIRELQQRLARFDAPRQIPAFTLLASRRGPVQSISIPRGAHEIQISVDVTADDVFPAYLIQIGSSIVRASAPPPGGLVQVLFPVSSLPTGQASLRVQGVRPDGSQSEVTNYPVKIQESP